MSGPPLPPGALATLPSLARRVRRQLLLRITLIQATGAIMVFLYLEQAFPSVDAFENGEPSNVWAFVVMEAVLAPVAWWWGSAHFRRVANWALTGRLADERERARILGEPWWIAMRPFVLWLGAATVSVIAGVRGGQSRELIVDYAQVITIGGLATCTMSYLAIEQTLRPLFAYALAGEAPARSTTLGIRFRLALAWAVGSGVPLVGVALVPLRETATSTLAIGILGGAGIVGGFAAIALASNSVAEPLDEIRAALSRVGEGDLDVGIPVDDGGEVGQLQAGFNQMVHGLRERAELADLFGRHVGAEVAEQAIERGTDLGGEQRRASIIFVDLIGSTAMAEVLPPSEVVATLNAFFGAVVDVVSSEGGWVNKFEGDGALCVFGVPALHPDHERRALRAARALRTRLAELEDDFPGLDAGIGVSSGLVVAGNVGTVERFEYTVIGRAVNEAARLTDLAKQRPSRVLASAAAVRAGGMEGSNWTDRGRVGLRGQTTPTVIFEPRGVPLSVLPPRLEAAPAESS